MEGEKNYGKWFLPALIVVAIGIVVWDISQKNLSQPKTEMGQVEVEVAQAYQTGDFPKAIHLLENALKLQPERNKDLRYSLIQIYLQINSLAQAREHLKICLEKLGRIPELLFVEAQICMREGEKDKAYQIFTEIVSQTPQFLPARMGMVEISMGKKDFANALLQIQEIQKNFPDLLTQIAHIYLFEADIHFSMEQFDKAKTALENFMKIHPNVFGVHRDWIEAMCALGQISEVKKQYKERLESEGISAKEKLFYQQLYALILPPQEAIAMLEEIMKSDDSPSVRMGLTSLWTKEGEYQKAILACHDLKGMQEVIEEKRLSWLGHALYLSGDSAQARKAYEEILKNPQARSSALPGLINLELSDKNFSLALDHSKILLEDAKNLQERLNAEMLQSRIHYEANQLEESLKTTQKILDETPAGVAVYSHALYKKAQIFLAQKKYKESAEIFQQIAEKITRVCELRLKAALWHGAALYLQGEDPLVAWKKYQDFPWDSYIQDTRMKGFLDVLTGKAAAEVLIPLKKMPFHANDVCFFLGLYYEIQKDYAKAYQSYEEGIQSSKGNDFPLYELLNSKQRVDALREKK